MSLVLPSWAGWVFSRKRPVSYVKDKDWDARVLKTDAGRWRVSLHSACLCPLSAVFASLPLPPTYAGNSTP